MVTRFGVFGVFLCADGTLKVHPPIAFESAAEATRAGEFLAGALGGAVAFSRGFDPRTGSAQDGVIIGKFGLMADREKIASKAA